MRFLFISLVLATGCISTGPSSGISHQDEKQLQRVGPQFDARFRLDGSSLSVDRDRQLDVVARSAEIAALPVGAKTRRVDEMARWLWQNYGRSTDLKGVRIRVAGVGTDPEATSRGFQFSRAELEETERTRSGGVDARSGTSIDPRPDSIPAGVPYEEIVHAYVAAFNAHDTEAMLRMVTDDVQWLSVDGEGVSVETNTKDGLRRSMNEYFRGCASCSSTIAESFATRGRVAALEIAGSDRSRVGRKRQSLSVYEFSGKLIKRVYYFPLEK